MSSDNLENTPWSPRNPAERVLMLLKMHVSLTAADIGKQLGTTGEAARQQLVRLAEDGLVTSESVRAGVGRPSQQWSLTAAAQTRFPDTHAALTVELLDIIRNNLGEDVLSTIIARREQTTRNTYQSAMRDCDTLKGKVELLARLRSAEGYMAAVAESEDGALVLTENHCPICAAATACQGFCRAELQVFRAVLGPCASVERVDHIVNGGRRCTYVIREEQQ